MANAIQTIQFSPAPTGGTYALTYSSDSPVMLNFNDDAATIQAALEGSPSIGSGNIAVSGEADTGTITLTFIGALANTNVPQTTCDASGLSCQGSIGTVAETQAGYYEYDLGWSAASQGGNGVTSYLTINGITVSPGFFDASTVQGYLTSADPSVQVTGGYTDLNYQDGSGNEMFSGSFVILYKTEGAITSALFSSSLVDSSGNPVDFSPNGAGAGVAEIETIPAPTATAGSFTLAYNSEVTGSLTHNALMVDVQNALNGLSAISDAGGVTVTGTDGGPYIATWGSNGPQSLLTADGTGLSASVVATARTTQPGSPAASRLMLMGVG